MTIIIIIMEHECKMRIMGGVESVRWRQWIREGTGR
jgi:hypothetical protein